MVIGSQAVVVALEGHLTQESLEAALARAEAELSSAATMIIDCRAMTGYDGEARSEFVEWHRAHRDQLDAVAIVTDKMLWHMIVSAMSLASRQRMRAFDNVDDAESWLAGS